MGGHSGSVDEVAAVLQDCVTFLFVAIPVRRRWTRVARHAPVVAIDGVVLLHFQGLARPEARGRRDGVEQWERRRFSRIMMFVERRRMERKARASKLLMRFGAGQDGVADASTTAPLNSSNFGQLWKPTGQTRNKLRCWLSSVSGSSNKASMRSRARRSAGWTRRLSPKSKAHFAFERLCKSSGLKPQVST
jgi:hypothetical protein